MLSLVSIIVIGAYTVKNGVLQYALFGASATLAVVHPIGCNYTPQNSVPLHPSNTPV